MNRLRFECDGAQNFPLNVTSAYGASYNRQYNFKQLNEHQGRLFCSPDKAVIDFLEYGHGSHDYWSPVIRNVEALRAHLGLNDAIQKRDPWIRCMFVDAPNSRANLNTTREMLALALTYLQYPADIVDFLLPFGRQREAKDFHFSAFRQRTRLSSRRQGLCIDELGWSGSDIHVYYNLKCVERTGHPSHREWSIRHLAVSHTFDVKKIRQHWTMIKGNDSLRQRVTDATRENGSPELRLLNTIDRAFAASLELHLVICEMAAQNWRWQINDLEQKFEDLSHRVIADDVDAPFFSPLSEKPPNFPPSRNDTNLSRKSFRTIVSRKRTETFKTMASIDEKVTRPPLRIVTDPETGNTQPLPPGMDDEDMQSPPGSPKPNKYGQEGFTFGDLQRIHHVDGKANEALLVIKHNRTILKQLKDYYSFVTQLSDFPSEIATQCREDLDQFNLRIQGVDYDLDIQAERLQNLLTLVADRKTLLHGILDLRNAQSNMALARESRASTKNMESMTNEMNKIAIKTKTETVSMKIITLVTLFFLPGTFISVCRLAERTLMSTSIFQNKDLPNPGPDPFAKLSPLQVYLAVSIPLTIITLLIWTCFHFWEKRNADAKHTKAENERTSV